MKLTADLIKRSRGIALVDYFKNSGKSVFLLLDVKIVGIGIDQVKQLDNVPVSERLPGNSL